MLEHYVTICLFLGLFTLSFLGVGDARTVGMVGLVLCAVGLVQPPERADLRVLLPLTGYNLVSALSSWATYGDVVYGYASTQAVFPVLFLLLSSLDGGDRRLLRRLCAGWAGTVAAIGVGQFLFRAATLGVKRLGGLLGNPNATGIFLVLGWFVLMSCAGERDCPRLLRRLEPVILAALALTLSMGSFLAMAAGIAVVVLDRRGRAREEALRLACRLLAKASLGVGSGILLYLAADRTGTVWLSAAAAVYLAALALCWEEFDAALRVFRPLPLVLSAAGVLVALTAVLICPSAAATFIERLEMMRNGMRYLLVNPVLGVGPYQWRQLNMADGDKYFNTYHIHNALIHTGVELGLIAAALLAATAVHLWRAEKRPEQRGALAAFFCHNMIDTSFFYAGITALVLLTSGEAEVREQKSGPGAARVIFAAAAVLFAYDVWRMLPD